MNAKDLNESAVIDRLLVRGWVSAPSLAKEWGLPTSTAVSVIRRMTERGVIRRGDDMPGKRGRPLATYLPVLPRPLVVCLVDGTIIEAAQIESDLSVHHLRQQTKSAGTGARGWIEEIAEVIQSLVEGTNVPKVLLCVNAVAIGGQTLTSSVVPGIGEVLGRLLAKKLPIDVQWCQWPLVLASYRRQEDPAPDPMLLFHVADGVSAHCMIGGSVFRGSSGLAGELGHVVVDEDGPTCGCGREGCLQACCSGPAICERILEGLKDGIVSGIDPAVLRKLPPTDVMEIVWTHWQGGDEFIRQVMDRVLDRLAWALGLAINLIDPEVVSVAGYVLRERAAWVEEIERRMQRWVVHASRRNVRIVESRATTADILQAAALQHAYHNNRSSDNHVSDQEAAVIVHAEQHLQRLLEGAT